MCRRERSPAPVRPCRRRWFLPVRPGGRRGEDGEELLALVGGPASGDTRPGDSAAAPSR